MERIKLGQKVKSVAINRASVSENTKGRAILLDKCPCVKQIAYDNNIKRAVEVSQDDCIRFHLTPRPTYYLLVARCNTDMKGNVVGDEFTVEYVQMAESVYNDFIEGAEETSGGRINSILLTLVKKGDYSHVKVTASQYSDFPDALKAKIKELRKNKELIKSMWQMIDISTSMTVDQYVKVLESADGAGSQSHQSSYANHTPAIESDSVKDLQSDSNEFDQGDSFSDDFDSTPTEEAKAVEIKDKNPKGNESTKPKEQVNKPLNVEKDLKNDALGDDDFGEFDS